MPGTSLSVLVFAQAHSCRHLNLRLGAFVNLRDLFPDHVQQVPYNSNGTIRRCSSLPRQQQFVLQNAYESYLRATGGRADKLKSPLPSGDRGEGKGCAAVVLPTTFVAHEEEQLECKGF